MKKAIYFGFGIASLLFILGYFLKNAHLFGSIAMGIGLIFFAIGGLSGGAFIDGNQLRANFHTETKEDRGKRQKIILISGVIAIPNFAAGVLLFMV
ncbi:DUF5316 domain-containing protein [Virgibacillus oceani]|uniref:DUF5316 domain-containing protein n=1 Tax=Virgibacillus oceani TaxID=1479511 RepID=A0A917HPS2_9BACI|nr:DUF5316 domain-containing protein [Virgibacillus oceani]GGG86614.1 hypothetical protein GCM10011398_35540 [Virgibacillus oceani]